MAQRLPGYDADQRGHQSFDPDGIASLMSAILRPWQCPGCKVDWLKTNAPKTAVMAGLAERDITHTWSVGCHLKSYR